MPSLISKYAEPAIVVALIASLVGAGGSIYAVVLTNKYTVINNKAQNKNDQLNKFDASGDQIVAAYGEMIKALNSKKDISDAKQQVATVVAQQQVSIDLLLATFGKKDTDAAKKYQAALTDWITATRRMNGAGEIGDFVEAFGKVLDEKKYISSELHKSLRVSS